MYLFYDIERILLVVGDIYIFCENRLVFFFLLYVKDLDLDKMVSC